MKYKIIAHLDFTEDVLELDDDLTEEEVEKGLYEYVSSFFDWNYEKVEEWYLNLEFGIKKLITLIMM